MNQNRTLGLGGALRFGLISGGILVSISLIGMIELFGEREMIAGLLTLGHAILLLPPLYFAYTCARDLDEVSTWSTILSGTVLGLVSSIPLIVLLLLGSSFDLRQFLLHVSPELLDFLTLGQPLGTGIILLVAVLAAAGGAGAGITHVPDRVRSPVLTAVISTLIVGLLSEILLERVRVFFGSGAARLIFSGRAMRPVAALVIFLVVAAGSFRAAASDSGLRDRYEALPAGRQNTVKWLGIGLLVLMLFLLPLLLGTYLSDVIDNVGIFILMGLGLNIVVGFAGLLDLGYVAFFAIGAYTMAVLTSEGNLGFVGLSFWAAIPICIGVSALAGIILGMPVLRMRGDYLAIVTLGFGEIIRILALSDFLKPYIGGAQGVLQIPKPQVGSFALVQPNHLYYVILAGCLLAAFVAWRLSEARLGRQWMALREDEDVAEAMGIKLVSVKLLAFAIGASFSGLAGAIFASKLTSIFPHSFSLLISINVLSLIIVGGIGSIPGVAVGALILVGLPELLREFKEYRLLMYGALLIVMMVSKPEGFLPSQVRRRELHAGDEMFEAPEIQASEAGD